MLFTVSKCERGVSGLARIAYEKRLIIHAVFCLREPSPSKDVGFSYSVLGSI